MRQLVITRSITNRDAASIDKYLHDISKLPMVTVEQEAILARKIREGDENALEELTSANLRFVVSVAKQYLHQGVGLSDLINEGNLGLMKAAKRFDETRGFKFISYAVWWIRQTIMQAISEQSRVIRLPLNRIGLNNKINKTQSILEQTLERRPSNSEIAEALNIEESDVTLSKTSSVWHVSTDAPVQGLENRTILELIPGSNEDDPDGPMLFDSLQTEISRALSTIPPRERDVVLMFYGIGRNGARSLTEIAIEMGLTTERVRQLKQKGVERLRHTSRNKNLKMFLCQ
jgi:RNA polymerase primary sigma factor